LLATLVEWVLGSARTQPLVSVIEDLHWADPSTLELIQLLVEQGATAPLMLIYTARPEFRGQWPLRAHHTQLALNRLSGRDVRAMVQEIAPRDALSDDTIATLVERTGGVPLFVEELTRSVLESGDAGLTRRAIPVTLHDSLMARLDRLGPAREVLQIGAVLGSDFSYALLHAVHPIAEEQLQAALLQLADAELLYVRGLAPGASYQFKHALIRDAAYKALLRSRRKDLHRLIARTINEEFIALKEEHPEVLARHWTEAGEAEPAIAAWRKTGEAAYARHAFKEVEEGYRQALAILNTQPESPERDARELELTDALIPAIQFTRGYAASETVEAIERARVLAEKTGDLRPLTQMFAAWSVANTAGDYRAASEFADRILELAQREGSPAGLRVASHAQFWTHYYRGDLVAAEQHFLSGSALFNAGGFRQSPELASPPFDTPTLANAETSGLAGTNAATFGMAGANAAIMGRADTARERIRWAVAAARESQSPYGLSYAHSSLPLWP
jgi:predicted ATPase